MRVDFGELVRDPSGLGFERGDQVGVEQAATVALDTAPPLREKRHQPAGTLTHRLEPHEAVADVGPAERGKP